MRIHRFFISLPAGQQLAPHKKIAVEDEVLTHQWRTVLRFQAGQPVVLYDNTGYEYDAIITLLSKDRTEVEIGEGREVYFSPRLPLFLFTSLAKRDSFEWMIEKGTELGVSGFCPIVSEHSEKKDVNMERSRILIKEACEQSWRSIMPEIFEPIPLVGALENLSSIGGMAVALDPTGMPIDLENLREGRGAEIKGDRVNVFIGPEGGFSPRELELFRTHNVPIVSFGKQILRAETAAVAITSVLLLG